MSAGSGTSVPGLPVNRRGWRIAAGLVGVVLVVAAVLTVMGQQDALAQAWQAARSAPRWLLIAVVLSPLANWLFTSAVFWILTRRFAPVRPVEMASLVGSAWLLNMLPGKPGLIARVAYHRQISGIPVHVSLLVTLAAVLTGSVGIVLTIALQLAFDPAIRAVAPPQRLWPIAAVVIAMALMPAIILGLQRGRGRDRPFAGAAPAFAIAVALRMCETHIWALRYWLAFMLIGQPHAYGLCVIISGVSQVAGQMPVQLGVREWAVGLASTALSAAGPVSAVAAVSGLTVDLVGRVAEAICATPVALASYAWLLRHLKRLHRPDPGNSQPDRGV